MSATCPSYHFFSCVRSGLAAGIAGPVAPDSQRATLDVTLEVERHSMTSRQSQVEPLPPRKVQLYGPGDVTGFDARMVVRTDPGPDIGNFEPNYFPSVEFAEPDFPWRFSPGKESARGLQPWITLIVLQREGPDAEFARLRVRHGGIPLIRVHEQGNLPDLAHARRWAHVQATCEQEQFAEGGEEGLLGLLESNPECVVSRLLCARRLKPKTAYAAFVVPTHRLGVLAGLETDQARAEERSCDASVPAWASSKATTDEPVTLPYYYHWDFLTSARGDFEYLFRLLEARPMEGIGLRPMDCEDPGYGLVLKRGANGDSDEVHHLDLEGSLQSVETAYTAWGHDAQTAPSGQPSDQFQQALAAEVLGPPIADQVQDAAPCVVPPIYGRWHAAERELSPSNSGWLHQLNLDPRHRAAAGLGTEVVRKQQEALMASAWEQIGAVEASNEVLRRAQLGLETSKVLYRERLGRMPPEAFLRVSAPMHKRVLRTEGEAAGKTIASELSAHKALQAALSPAFRRIAGPRSAIRKRQPAPTTDLLRRLTGEGELTIAGPHPKPEGLITPCTVTRRLASVEDPDHPIVDFPGGGPSTGPSSGESSTQPSVESSGGSSLGGSADGALIGGPSTGPTSGEGSEQPSVEPPGGSPRPEFCEGDISDRMSGGSPPDAADLAEEHRGALAEAFDELLAPAVLQAAPSPPSLQSLCDDTLRAIDPALTIPKRTTARMSGAIGKQAGATLSEVMAYPEFPQPMWKPLAELAQSNLLPGIENIRQNTICLLKTNRRFIEAYMVGLNSELGRELLWRGYPTDQRGSYFRQFWNVDARVGGAAPDANGEGEVEGEEQDIDPRKDIRELHLWRDTPLGKNGVRCFDGQETRAVSNEDDRATVEQAEPLVLVVRGDLITRFPDAFVYALDAQKEGDVLVPDFEADPVTPIFGDRLGADLLFLGFPFDEKAARSQETGGTASGKFVVFEERLSEARFGLDSPPSPGEVVLAPGDPDNDAGWDTFHWDLGLSFGSYLDELTAPVPGPNGEAWDQNTSAAQRARITLQKPARLIVHADDLLPKRVSAS